MTETQRQELEALRQKLGAKVGAGKSFNDRTHDAYHRHNGADAPCNRKH